MYFFFYSIIFFLYDFASPWTILTLLFSNFNSTLVHTLFRKIISLYGTLPYPGELKNIIKTSVIFSNIEDKYDYFRRLYLAAKGKMPTDIIELKNEGFTLREIEILTGISKSSVSRELKGD